MRHYEIVFMVHPDQSEQVPAMIDRYKQMVEGTNGKMHRVEDWGRLQLAYPIQKIGKAHYVLMNVECDQHTLGEIENAFRFYDAVLRLGTRRDLHLRGGGRRCVGWGWFLRRTVLRGAGRGELDFGRSGAGLGVRGGACLLLVLGTTTRQKSSRYQQSRDR